MSRLVPSLFALLTIFSTIGCGPSPESVAREYVECAVRGDIEGMKAHAAGEVAAKLADPTASSAMAEDKAAIEEAGGISGCEVIGQSISGDSATVIVQLVPKRRAPHIALLLARPRPLRLSRIDGVWKVVGE